MELTEALLSTDPARMASRAFLVAILVTLIGPVLLSSWSATWSSLLRWSPGRVGGVALAAGALSGATVSTWLRHPMGIVLGVAAGVGVMSWRNERGERTDGAARRLDLQALRRAFPLVAAGAVVAAGVRLPLTLLAPIDAVLTIAWLAGLPRALALLDRRGEAGLRTIACAAISVTLLVLAIDTGNGAVAAAGAATAGALLALQAQRSSRLQIPASRIDGSAWLVVAFLLAVATVQIVPGIEGAGALAVGPLLWALPVADGVMAGLARARRRLGWSGRTGGHLLRRLAARGVGDRAATALTAAVHVLAVGAGLAAGLGRLTAGLALAVGLAGVAGLVALVYSAPVHRGEVSGLPRSWRIGVLAVGIGIPVLAAPAAWAVVGSRARLQSAARLAEGALERVREGDTSAPVDEPAEPVDPADPASKEATKETKPAKPAKSADRAGSTAGTEAAGDAVDATGPEPRKKRAREDCGSPRDPVTCLEEAAAVFDSVADRLSGPLVAMAQAVPVVSPNVRATRTLLEAGRDLATAGGRLATTADTQKLRFRGGALPLDEVRLLSKELDAASLVFGDVRTGVARLDNPYLFTPVRRLVDDLALRLASTDEQVQSVADAARLAPAILGGSGTRRYFLAVQNNAEVRGTGGLIGNFGVLEATDGRLTIERFGRIKDLRDNGLPLEQRVLHFPPDDEYLRRYGEFQPESTWQNVNMSPDFPTVGRAIVDLFPQSGGQTINGVIAFDSVGLAALLELTGPISVGEWPEKITSENVVDVTLSEAYERFSTKAERVDFLAEVADTVVAKLAGGGLPQPVRMAKVLGDVAQRRHISMYLVGAQEQQLLARLGIDGRVDPPVGDSVFVVNQNASANKVDYYLRRRLRYAIDLRPRGRTAEAAATLDLVLENGAPSSKRDPYVIGPNAKGLAPGENLSITSAYSVLDLTRATLVDSTSGELDVTRELGADTELGHNVYRRFISIPAQGSTSLRLELDGTVNLEPGGWYRLELPKQPLLSPDSVDIEVNLPAGWRAAEVQGLTLATQKNPPAGSRRVLGHIELDGDRTVRIRIERS